MATDGLTYTWVDADHFAVRITGHRISAAHAALVEWSQTTDCRVPLSVWTPRQISLAHALWEADQNGVWPTVVGALLPSDYADARDLGLLG